MRGKGGTGNDVPTHPARMKFCRNFVAHVIMQNGDSAYPLPERKQALNLIQEVLHALEEEGQQKAWEIIESGTKGSKFVD